MLEKEQRKALRREAKDIRETFAQLWGEDGETRKKREALQRRYAEIEQILLSERKRVLAECRQIWEDYGALRADQDEAREELMVRYKELYHILRKRKEDKANVTPGSDEDIPSPQELADGRQPPGSEVVFDFSSFIVSEEHSGDAPKAPSDQAPISDRATVPGKPLPTFSESGEVTLNQDDPEDKAGGLGSSGNTENDAQDASLDFTIPSFEETGGLPLVNPEDFDTNRKPAAKLPDEVWVENDQQSDSPAPDRSSGLDALDLDDLLGGGSGAAKSPPLQASSPEKPRPDEQKTQIGAPPPTEEGDKGFLDATWDSSPEVQFPQSAKRDEALPPLRPATPAPKESTEDEGLPPLQDFEEGSGKSGDNTTDSGSWDAMQRNAKKQAPGSEAKKGEDDGDVIFG